MSGLCFHRDKGNPRFGSQFQGIFVHFIQRLSVETPNSRPSWAVVPETAAVCRDRALAAGQLYKSKHDPPASPRMLLPLVLSPLHGPLIWMGCSLYPAVPAAAAPCTTYGQ